jgi:hypothetical protein
MGNQLHTMSEYPPEWAIFPKDDFALACPRDPDELGAELMVIARPTGRLQDHFRVAIGGSKPLQALFSTKDVFTTALMPEASLQLNVRPAEVKIRRNQTTSEWHDVTSKLKARDILAYRQLDTEDEDDTEDLLELIEQLADKEEVSASYRWAVGVTTGLKLELVLQRLPASAKHLNSKPIFKG